MTRHGCKEKKALRHFAHFSHNKPIFFLWHVKYRAMDCENTARNYNYLQITKNVSTNYITR